MPEAENKPAKRKFFSLKAKALYNSLKRLIRKDKTFKRNKDTSPYESQYDFGDAHQPDEVSDLFPCINTQVSFNADFESEYTKKDYLCKLCLENYYFPSEMYTLSECKCVFCLECLTQYFSTQITDGNVSLTCPDGNCKAKGKIREKEIKALIPIDLFQRYEQFKLNQEIEEDPTRCWCPKSNCSAICFLKPPPEGEGGPVYCNNCHHVFCYRCKKPWHSRRTCQEIEEIQNNAKVWNKEKPTKLCPRCFVPIEKFEGCMQMRCTHCKTVFCWICLTRLDNDLFNTHYSTNGTCCFNVKKPTNTQASCLRIMLTYTGIFVVTLLFSPLLIFSTPIILFCLRSQHP